MIFSLDWQFLQYNQVLYRGGIWKGFLWTIAFEYFKWTSYTSKTSILHIGGCIQERWLREMQTSYCISYWMRLEFDLIFHVWLESADALKTVEISWRPMYLTVLIKGSLIDGSYRYSCYLLLSWNMAPIIMTDEQSSFPYGTPLYESDNILSPCVLTFLFKKTAGETPAPACSCLELTSSKSLYNITVILSCWIPHICFSISLTLLKTTQYFKLSAYLSRHS